MIGNLDPRFSSLGPKFDDITSTTFKYLTFPSLSAPRLLQRDAAASRPKGAPEVVQQLSSLRLPLHSTHGQGLWMSHRMYHLGADDSSKTVSSRGTGPGGPP